MNHVKISIVIGKLGFTTYSLILLNDFDLYYIGIKVLLTRKAFLQHYLFIVSSKIHLMLNVIKVKIGCNVNRMCMNTEQHSIGCKPVSQDVAGACAGESVLNNQLLILRSSLYVIQLVVKAEESFGVSNIFFRFFKVVLV